MYCYYCHNQKNFKKCNCYLIDMGDGLTCMQCNRAQINQIYTHQYEKNENISNETLKHFDIIYEYCEKLNLDEKIKIPLTNFYNLLVEQIDPSTYNRKYILLYAIYIVSIKYDIYTTVSRLSKLADCPLNFFHKTANLKKKKKIYFSPTPFEKQCSSLLIQMGVFNIKHQNEIISTTRKILKISNNKIPTILSASFCFFQSKHNAQGKNWRKFVHIASSATQFHYITIVKCFKKYFENKNINM